MVKMAAKRRKTDRTLPIRRELAQLRQQRDRAAKFALTERESATYTALVVERSDQIRALEIELERVAQESGLQDAVQKLTPTSLRELIRSIDDPARLLRSLVERIELDRTLTGRIVYRAAVVPSRGVSMASPRVSPGYATVKGQAFRVA
jgi:hypothetical protein